MVAAGRRRLIRHKRNKKEPPLSFQVTCCFVTRTVNGPRRCWEETLGVLAAERRVSHEEATPPSPRTPPPRKPHHGVRGLHHTAGKRRRRLSHVPPLGWRLMEGGGGGARGGTILRHRFNNGRCEARAVNSRGFCSSGTVSRLAQTVSRLVQIGPDRVQIGPDRVQTVSRLRT